MANVTGKQYPVGMRHATVFELNTVGSPKATDTSPYEGLQIVGARAYDLTIPDVRRITHTGDDRPLAIDFLPPTEGMTAELRAARDDYDVYALLTGTNVITQNESSFIGVATSQQGLEPQVGLLLYQQALDDAGARSWRSHLFPKATIYPRPMGMIDNPAEHRYLAAPAVVSKHLWETAMVIGTEGYTDAQMLELMTTYRPKIIAFLGDTSETQFAFPADAYAADAIKITVWEDGVEQTTGVTKGTTQVEFASPPDTDATVVVFYERVN